MVIGMKSFGSEYLWLDKVQVVTRFQLENQLKDHFQFLGCGYRNVWQVMCVCMGDAEGTSGAVVCVGVRVYLQG